MWSAGHLGDAYMCTAVNSDVSWLSTYDPTTEDASEYVPIPSQVWRGAPQPQLCPVL